MAMDQYSVLYHWSSEIVLAIMLIKVPKSFKVVHLYNNVVTV